MIAGCSANEPNSQQTFAGFISTPSQTQPAAGNNLLYVVDPGTMGVMEYSFRPAAMRFIAFLNGVQDSFSACVDGQQNVWVTRQGTLMVRYAHGDTDPNATLSVRGGSPFDCSVDTQSGNLAVLASGVIYSTINVFKDARGRAHQIPLGRITEAYCSYDGNGNIFIIGQSSQRVAELFEIPAGQKTHRTITLKDGPALPGGIAWDGTYLDIADSQSDTIDRFTIDGSNATLHDSIPLDASGTIGKFAISGKYLIVPFQSASNGFVNVYAYPAGGKRIRTLRNFTIPRAVAVSRGAKA